MARTTPRIWTDADYAARGFGRLTLRMGQEILRKLSLLSASSNRGRTALIGTLIEEKYNEVFNGK